MATLTIAERFKDARTVHNIHKKQSMKTVEQATGVSASMIKDLEAGSERSVGYDKIMALAKHYYVSVDWLLGLSEDIEFSPGELSDLGISAKSKNLILRNLENNNELRSFSTFINDMVEIGMLPELRRYYDKMVDTAQKHTLFSQQKDELQETFGYQAFSPEQAIPFYASEIAELIKHAIIRKYEKGVPFDYFDSLRNLQNVLAKLDKLNVEE